MLCCFARTRRSRYGRLPFLFRRKGSDPSSFLFRRKEAKENRLRLSFFSALLSLSPTCSTKRTASFLFRRKNGQLAREAQPLRRTDAGTSCVVVGRNTAAGMPPSSALSLPVSAAPARRLSRANRPCKRKSNAAELLFCAFAAFANLQHKTDGSYVNRPFFRSLCRTCGKTPFLKLSSYPAVSFVSFLQEKKTSPLEEKKSFPF